MPLVGAWVRGFAGEIGVPVPRSGSSLLSVRDSGSARFGARSRLLPATLLG